MKKPIKTIRVNSQESQNPEDSKLSSYPSAHEPTDGEHGVYEHSEATIAPSTSPTGASIAAIKKSSRCVIL